MISKELRMASEHYRKLHKELWNRIATEVWIQYNSGKLGQIEVYDLKSIVAGEMLNHGLITRGEYEECRINAFCFACVYVSKCYSEDKETEDTRCEHCIITWNTQKGRCSATGSPYRKFSTMLENIADGIFDPIDSEVAELAGYARQIANLEWHEYE